MANIAIFVSYQRVNEQNNLEVFAEVRVQGQVSGASPLPISIVSDWSGSVNTINNAIVAAAVAAAQAAGFTVSGGDAKLLFCGAA